MPGGVRRQTSRVGLRSLRLRRFPKLPVRRQALFHLSHKAHRVQSYRPAHDLRVVLDPLCCRWRKARRRWTLADPYSPGCVGRDPRRTFPDQLFAADGPRMPRPRARRHLRSLPQPKTERDDLRRRGQPAARTIAWTNTIRTMASCRCCCRHRLRETNAGKPVIPRAAASFLVEGPATSMGGVARRGPNLSDSNYDQFGRLEGGKKLSSDNIPTIYRNRKPFISRNLVASFPWP